MTNSSWQAASCIMQALEAEQYEAVIVGGAVRDSLLQKKAHDVDVATNALPEQTKAIFKKTVDVGIEHGTILVLDFKEPIEVTTYRTDGEYTDHRRPDEVIFVSALEEDLKRRDFTINALAYRLNGEIVDLFGGKKDLEQRIIRAVGVPEERFLEDGLRILRALRFSAQLDFQIEEHTRQAMFHTAHVLEFIARERMKVEFDKIFKTSTPVTAFQTINQSAIAQYLPGDFSAVSKWEHLNTDGDSKIGWAFWSYLMNDSALLTAYKCSNEEKRFARDVATCMTILENERPTKLQLFQMDTIVWQAAIRCQTALHDGMIQVEESELIARKDNLPIQSSHDIVVSGRHLMQWSGRKGGPWLKEQLSEMMEEIVEGRLINDEVAIQTWFHKK